MEARTSKRAKEMLCEEIERIIGEGNSLKGKLELLHMLTDTLKNLYKIEMYEEAEHGYSRDGREYRDRRYSRDGNSMDSSYGGSSYDYSGRRHYVRGHYSRDDGREEMMGKLDELMNEAPTDKDREAIRRCMNLMQNA